MNPLSASRRIAVAASLMPILAILGCGSSSKPAAPGGAGRVSTPVSIPGVQRATSAMSALRNLRDQLIAERTQADKTLAALSEVVNGQGDLQQPLVNFTTAINDLSAAQQKVLQRIEEMRGGAREYLTGWEVEVLGVEDPELRHQAEQRRNQVRGNYTRINESLKTGRAAYERFETSLNDLQRFLANDLTPAGVKGAAASAQKTRDAGNALRQQIDASVAELDRVSGEMTPAGGASRGATAP